MSTPPEESPTRTLQAALGAMALVAVTVGLVVGGLVLALTQYAGVDEVAQASTRQAPATMSIPPYKPTQPAKDEPGVKTYDPSPSPTVALPAQSQPSSAVEQGTGITLSVTPTTLSPGQQINLTGRYGREGASLQVQRQQGGPWTDFPVSALVSGGSYSTYIVTSLTGTAQLRMIDRATGTTSNAVTVTIR